MALLDSMVRAMTSLMAPLPEPLIAVPPAPADPDCARRRAAMDRAWAAYRGDFPDPLRVPKGAPNDNVKVNLIRPLVTATVHFLFGQPPGLELPNAAGGQAGSEPSPDELWLAGLLRATSFPIFALDLATNGALCGTPYARLDPAPPGGPYPRLSVLDSRLMSILVDPRDCEAVLEYRWEYHVSDTAWWRQRTVLVETGWVIVDERSTDSGKHWTLAADPQRWAKPYPPILHGKNLPAPNQVYGEPDVTDSMIALNAAINFNKSNRQRIDKYHGHPRVWLRHMEGQKVDFSVDAAVDLGEGEIGQLVPAVTGEAAASLGRELYEALCEEASTPSIVLGRADQAGDPSGVALRVKLWPLLMKTETKRALYGPFLVELLRRAFDLAGRGPNRLVSLTWPEVLPQNPTEERTVLAADLAMGVVSRQTVARKLDYTWATEQENLRQEAGGAPPSGGTDGQAG